MEADHIPPKCVFKNLNGNPFYRVAKWQLDTKHTEYPLLFLSEDVEQTIKAYEEIIESENKIKDENKSKQKNKNKQKAIEICFVKNEYEKMILEKMRLIEADDKNKEKLEELKEKIFKNTALYDLICESGDNGACRNVRKSHHEEGLTYGGSTCAQAIR